MMSRKFILLFLQYTSVWFWLLFFLRFYCYLRISNRLQARNCVVRVILTQPPMYRLEEKLKLKIMSLKFLKKFWKLLFYVWVSWTQQYKGDFFYCCLCWVILTHIYSQKQVVLCLVEYYLTQCQFFFKMIFLIFQNLNFDKLFLASLGHFDPGTTYRLEGSTQIGDFHLQNLSDFYKE